jgi:hypothetical protein
VRCAAVSVVHSWALSQAPSSSRKDRTLQKENKKRD